VSVGNHASRPPESSGPPGEEAAASPRQAGHRGSDGVVAVRGGGWLKKTLIVGPARPVDGQDQGEQPLTGLQKLRASKNLLTN
jgi:hypothetical protein